MSASPVTARAEPPPPAHRRASLAARYRADPQAQREASRRWKERDPEGFRAMTRASAQRKKRRHPEAFATELDRLAAYRDAQRERTDERATKVKVRWTDEDDAYVLATLDRPLAEVALRTGFGSASAFSRAFRRHAGTTAQEARASARARRRGA